ncbi:MAG: superoxide dismutase family protein [Gemmatimonadota bacterium]
MKRRTAAAYAAAIALAGCASISLADPVAKAELKPTQGNTATGTVQFTQQGNKVVVTVRVSGLAPNSEHGFHVHEKGDCSAPDGTSAGGHFNPGGKPHARFDQREHHAGDLPNLRADVNGHASYLWETDALSVGSGTNDVVGRAVIIHRDPDDYKSQPAGNSGPRIACGVIAAAR